MDCRILRRGDDWSTKIKTLDYTNTCIEKRISNRYIENQANEKVREIATPAKTSCTNKSRQNSTQIGSVINNISNK